MIIGKIVKPGKLKSHKYAQCYWRDCSVNNRLDFVSFKSIIFTVVETDYCLKFYPHITSPNCSKTTAKHTLWALYELGYDYKQAKKIKDGLQTKNIVKA